MPNTGLTLAALPGESDGFSFNTLYGVTTEKVAAGTHVIRIVRTDSPGIDERGPARRAVERDSDHGLSPHARLDL